MSKKAKSNRMQREKDLEDWMLKQFERYIKIHKDAEKEISYIG